MVQGPDSGGQLARVPLENPATGQPGVWGHPEYDASRSEGLEPGVDWRRYAAALLRYKWLIASVTVLGTGAGVVATHFIPRQYRSQATVWIGAERQGGGERGPIRSGQLLDSYSWIELLRTFEVLEHVVREERLYLSPPDSLLAGFTLQERFAPGRYRLVVDDQGQRFTLSQHEGIVIQRGVVGDSVGAMVGFEWAPSASVLTPAREIEFTVLTPRDAAVELGERMRARIDQNGNFMRVDLTGTDPQVIANTLNAVLERYVEFAAELKRDRLTELTKILEGQLETAARNLAESENALESFRVTTISLPSENAGPVAPGLQMTQSPVLNSFFQMKTQLEELRQDRVVLGRILDEARTGGVSVEAIEAVPSAQSSSELTALLGVLVEKRAERRALLARYTAEHRSVRQLTEQIEALERRSIPEALEALRTELGARQRELATRVETASGDLQQVPPRAIEEARLRRAVTVAEGLYTELEQRYSAARLAEVSSIPDVRVLDRAVAPQRPVSNQVPRVVMLAFAGSLGLAVVAALLLDRFDSRVRYPDQVVRRLGLPVLGSIPRAEASGGHGIVEALRGIRLNMVHLSGGAGVLSVTISSPGSGEGKSFVSANLALAFAQAGHRTLLIDGDNRRGTLHRLFGMNRKPGLTELLTGAGLVDDTVQTTRFDHLSFVGCGTRVHNAPELLGSPSMGQLLNRFRSSYGVIVVDSPPLSAGVDAFALGTLVGSMAVVLRTGVTNKELAQAKLDVLGTLPVRILGAILNDVRPGTAAGSYYAYYSYYLPGYEARDEEGRQVEGLLSSGAKG